jgi:hypothetical protein
MQVMTEEAPPVSARQQLASAHTKLRVAEYALEVGVDVAAAERGKLAVQVRMAEAEVAKLQPLADQEVEQEKKERLTAGKRKWMATIEQANATAKLWAYYSARTSLLHQRLEGQNRLISMQRRQVEMEGDKVYLGEGFWGSQELPPDFDLADALAHFEQEFQEQER